MDKEPKTDDGGLISRRARLVRLTRDPAVRDVLVLLPLIGLITAVLIQADFFEGFVELTRHFEDYELDELFVAGFPASTAITWFSYRRLMDNRREVRRRKEIEADRNVLREQLLQVQKMKAIGELAGGIAHDFNNLLMVIDGFGQRAKSRLGDEIVLRECLDQIISASDRGAALTRQLLVFSRRQAMEKAVVTIAELIEGIRGLLKHTLAEHFEVRFDIEDPNVRIETDANEFIQALLNLVINARDAMPNGGRILISSKEIVAEAGQPSLIKFGVKDTGVGMDEATQKRMFEPFFTTKGRDKGTGLGLAMVYGFVKGCGGRIEVSSAPGEGTEFSLYFPTTNAGPARTVAEDIGQQLGMGETILLVEDNEALLNVVKMELEQIGYNVLSATGAFWALEIDEDYTGPIDLLLTDVIMPGMSGIELAKAMAENRPHMKTIFMSGYTDESKKTGALPAGATFLQKPVKVGRLASVIREVIEEDVARRRAS